MQDFQLPVLTGDSLVEASFEPMIRANVSGCVVDVFGEFRLLHFTQLRAAWEAHIRQLLEVTGYIKLVFNAFEMDPTSDYEFVGYWSPGSVMVRSRHEPLSFVYTAGSPGYACNGPMQHTYPALRRGPTNRCVVSGCPGTI
jgi:hypothetical protein